MSLAISQALGLLLVLGQRLTIVTEIQDLHASHLADGKGETLLSPSHFELHQTVTSQREKLGQVGRASFCHSLQVNLTKDKA